MSKYCKKCWKLNQNPLLKFCMEHQYLNSKLQHTKLKAVSSKKLKRLKDTGGEKETFKKVYTRNKNCVICNKYVNEPKGWNFPHLLAKWQEPALRNFINNIYLVCSIECHNEFDKLHIWINRKEMKQRILNWEFIY